MAERRMFAKTIIDSDAFMELSKDAKLLYFFLGMVAYDKGIVINAKKTAEFHNIDTVAIVELVENKYLIEEEDGHYRIVHWYENNGIGETAKKRNNYSYRKWREAVLKRDGYKCSLCGSGDNLVAHHIKSFADFPELRLDLGNGTTLCATCHIRLHGLEKKEGK